MNGVTRARIDRVKGSLQLVCDESITATKVASDFTRLLNSPENGGRWGSPFLVSNDGLDLAEITYAGRKQAIVMRDGNSVHIADDHKGVGIQDICSAYRWLCRQYKVTPTYVAASPGELLTVSQ